MMKRWLHWSNHFALILSKLPSWESISLCKIFKRKGEKNKTKQNQKATGWNIIKKGDVVKES